jgi:hypothetical protein
MELEYSQQIFEESSNIKFHENLYSQSRVVPCGWADRRTNMTKLIAAFRTFTNAPKRKIKFMKYLSAVCDGGDKYTNRYTRKGNMLVDYILP